MSSHTRNRVRPGVPEGGQFATTKRADADPGVTLLDPSRDPEAMTREAAATYGRSMFEAGKASVNPNLSGTVRDEAGRMITRNADEALTASLSQAYSEKDPGLPRAREAVLTYGEQMFKAGQVVADPAHKTHTSDLATSTMARDAWAELDKALSGTPDDEDDYDEDEDLVADDPTACNSCGNYLPTDDERKDKTCRPCADTTSEPLLTFQSEGDEFGIDRTGEGHYTIYRNGNYLGEFYRAGDPEDHSGIEEVARARLGI